MSSFNVPADDRLDDEIERNVTRALAEDVGPGDLTAQLVPASQHARATVIAPHAAPRAMADSTSAASAVCSRSRASGPPSRPLAVMR